ncbi:hypothetical protein FPSE_00001 [Fusarium pseudograminearum CS3096]|uniref:Secreted protein n=1 Tax=Fusarium pseudograminearum (strain CS3096) TaxID=1028729 RepID=K3VWZ8_FUSPC|nr:hypothetical protein FPSE_00001 [Fusarium pseudograminearum CS3096]EKJ79818.1 hypothetical protein FPSE_00001 [Fusarium pseudograminearum CS3096]
MPMPIIGLVVAALSPVAVTVILQAPKLSREQVLYQYYIVLVQQMAILDRSTCFNPNSAIGGTWIDFSA